MLCGKEFWNGLYRHVRPWQEGFCLELSPKQFGNIWSLAGNWRTAEPGREAASSSGRRIDSVIIRCPRIPSDVTPADLHSKEVCLLLFSRQGPDAWQSQEPQEKSDLATMKDQDTVVLTEESDLYPMQCGILKPSLILWWVHFWRLEHVFLFPSNVILTSYLILHLPPAWDFSTSWSFATCPFGIWRA